MIYAIEHPYEPLCKVGFTCDVARRMREYASHGLIVKPFKVVRGGRAEEKRVHSLLTDAWEGGEWFCCSREAVSLAMENVAWQ